MSNNNNNNTTTTTELQQYSNTPTTNHTPFPVARSAHSMP
jgi:hypothetical protein